MNLPSQSQVARAFGKVLATCRHNAKLSQEELAFRAGLDRTYPSLMDRGLRQPTIGRLIALGFAMRVDPSTLLIMTMVQLREGQS